MNRLNGNKHILSILVENQPGVLSRIAGLFSGRGFNIESLCVARTMDAEVSRMTVVTVGDRTVVEQIKKQLNKLIDVIKVTEMTGTDCVERETALVKIRAKSDERPELLRLVDIFRSKVVDVNHDSCTVEISGDEGKLVAFLNLLKPMGIKEIARTGIIALAREKK